MTRCIVCNFAEFYEVNSKEVDKYFVKVDFKKPNEIDKFWVCKKCDQIFWIGS